MSCIGLADFPEDQAVQNDQDQHRDDDQTDRVGNHHVVTGVRWILPNVCHHHVRHQPLLGEVRPIFSRYDGHIGGGHFGAKFEEARNVE